MTVLLLAEATNGKLSPLSAKALTAARQLGNSVDVLLAGAHGEAADDAAMFEGVGSVLVANGGDFSDDLPEPLSELILSLAADYSAVVAAATSLTKATLPRVAARLDVMQISEAVDIVAPDTFKRPIYAGNAIETVRTRDTTIVVTVRASSFAVNPKGGNASVRQVSGPSSTGLSTLISRQSVGSERPDLASARVVVSGGRAFGSKEQFDALLEPLADKLGAAIGASRAAVDAGYAANDLQVGQTGKIVAPDLYIACGISGAIQHVAGMKDARIVVAINSDPEAPIFQVADYCLVGDLFTIIPELLGEL